MQTVIETSTGWMIQCCNCQWHEFPKMGRPGASWTFNGNLERPTFSPSMNEHLNPPGHVHHNPEVQSRRCHFVITDGQIKYCDDCSHDLRGRTMPLEAWPEEKVRYYAALKASEGWQTQHAASEASERKPSQNP